MGYSEEHEIYIREHKDIQPDEDYEMDLTDRDRKKLWASAGGECSRCKSILYQKASKTNFGEECHISSEKQDQPSKEFSRFDPKLEKRNKSVDNAILLCGHCHKIIDNPENTQYTIEALHQRKENHEADIIKRHAKKIHDKKIERDEHEKVEQTETEKRKDRCKELEGELRKHSNDLVKVVLNNWFNLRKNLRIIMEQDSPIMSETPIIPIDTFRKLQIQRLMDSDTAMAVSHLKTEEYTIEGTQFMDFWIEYDTLLDKRHKKISEEGNPKGEEIGSLDTIIGDKAPKRS